MTPLRGLRVLVVEDEGPIAMMIEDMMQDLGCVVVGSAASVGAARILVERGGFDFALLDMNLGGVKVESVALALAEAGIPFAFASGYGEAGLSPGFKGRPVLSKPFVIADLQRAILAALENRPG